MFATTQYNPSTGGSNLSRKPPMLPRFSLIPFAVLALLALHSEVFGQTAAPELVLQTGHMVGIHALAFSPHVPWADLGFPHRDGSGELLAVGGNDSLLELWDPVKRQQVRTLSPGSAVGVETVAFSRDGKLVAAGGSDCVKIWTVASGKPQHTLCGHDRYRSISFNHTGEYLAAGGENNVTVWSVPREIVLRVFDAKDALVAFNDQSLLAAAGVPRSPGELFDINKPYVANVWDVTTGQFIKSFAGHAPRVMGARFISTNELIVWGELYCKASADPCNTLDTWSLASGTAMSLPAPTEIATAATLCTGGLHLLGGHNDGVIGFFDGRAGRETYRSSKTGGFAEAVACSDDETTFASAEMGGRVFLWSRAATTPLATLAGVVNEVDSVAFTNSEILVTGNSGPNPHGYTESFSEWSFPSLRPPQITGGRLPIAVNAADGVYAFPVGAKQEANGAAITVRRAGVQTATAIAADRGVRMAFSKSGTLLAIGRDTSLSVWQMPPLLQTEVVFPTKHAFAINQVVFSPDETTVISAGSDGVAIAWDVAAKQSRCQVGQKGSPEHALWAVASNRAGTLFASGGNDGQITISSLTTCVSVHVLRPGGGSIQALAFSPDDSVLASAGSDGLISLWNLRSDTRIELNGHLWQVESLAFNARGNILASGSWDGTTKLWDLASHSELATLVTFSNLRDWAAVTPDGLFDASADAGRQLSWRAASSNELIPLDAYYSDFFHPGLIAALYDGQRPKPVIDLATRLRFPSLRVLGQAGIAHIERRDGRETLCIKGTPVGVPPTGVRVYSRGGRGVMPSIGAYVHDASRPDCAYRWALPPDEGPYRLSPAVPDSRPPAVDTSTGTLFVFVVGITKYEKSVHFSTGQTFPELPFASADADLVADFFRRQGTSSHMPFAKIVVKKVLRDSDATLEHIRAGLETLAEEVTERDVVLLFFAGHGIVQPNEEMFAFIPYLPPPIDELSAPLVEAREVGFSTAMLAEAIRKLRTGYVILVVDACQSGGALESLENIANMELRLYEIHQSAVGSVSARMPGIYLLAAATPIEEAGATDKLQHGILTSVVVSVLSRPGSRTTAWDVLDEVRRAVPLRARDQGWSQTPLVTHVGADYVISVTPRLPVSPHE